MFSVKILIIVFLIGVLIVFSSSHLRATRLKTRTVKEVVKKGVGLSRAVFLRAKRYNLFFIMFSLSFLKIAMIKTLSKRALNPFLGY